MATVRSSRVSRARYTSPIPPAPSEERISYGPRRVLGESGIAFGHHNPLSCAKPTQTPEQTMSRRPLLLRPALGRARRIDGALEILLRTTRCRMPASPDAASNSAAVETNFCGDEVGAACDCWTPMRRSFGVLLFSSSRDQPISFFPHPGEKQPRAKVAMNGSD